MNHLSADVILRGSLREALDVHRVLRHRGHAASPPFAPLAPVLSPVATVLPVAAAPASAATPVAPAPTAAATTAVSLATVLVAFAVGANPGNRRPLLELQLRVRDPGDALKGRGEEGRGGEGVRGGRV